MGRLNDYLRRLFNIASPIASVFSLINPAFLAIPVISSVTNELFAYFDAKSIEKRLKGLQDELIKQNIRIEDFAQRISELTEHERYVVRNNIRHLCLSAQPETTDMLNKAIIEYIMNESFGLAEHACEILQQCNSDDIFFLKFVKNFLMNKPKDEYRRLKDSALANENSGGFQDRIVLFGEDTTVIWKDFVEPLHLKSFEHDLGAFLSIPFQAELNGEALGGEITYLAQFAKSIVKLQNLSVLQCEYHTTLGTISLGNIERFHITLFGKKLLEYIELDDKESENHQIKGD